MNRTRIALALLSLAACSQARTSTETTLARIGASGGSLKSADGKLSLAFPSGALSKDTDVTIGTDHSTIRGDLSGAIYHFGPDGSQFQHAVEVKFSVAALPPEGEDYFVANTDSSEPALLEDSLFDESTMSVTAGLEHFSSYGLFHRASRCRNLPCGNVCGHIRGVTLACNARHRCVPASLIGAQCGGMDGGTPGDGSIFFDIDAGPFGPDAGLPLGDGGIEPPVDAGEPLPDAGSPFVDDAGEPLPDAGSPFVDDAGAFPFEDASQPALDAGAPIIDVGVPFRPDGG